MKYSNNFYKNVKYIEAHKFATKYINDLLSQSPDFEWITRKPEINSFDDIRFRYKDTVFSVLLKVFYKKDLLNSYNTNRELKWVDITDKNNFFAVVFPIEVEKNGDTYKCYSLMDGLNFWDWMSTDTFNVIDVASNN